MAFVRRRTTKAGTVSTALVEAYRDERGRPRQRVLANLHGADTPLEALAKLAAQRERLQEERAALEPDVEGAAGFYESITTASLDGHKFAAHERKEIDRFMAARRRLLRRAEKLDAMLARIRRDGAAIRKHVTASDDQIQAAIRDYKEQVKRAETMMLGVEFGVMRAKQELRKLSLPSCWPTTSDADKSFIRTILGSQ